MLYRYSASAPIPRRKGVPLFPAENISSSFRRARDAPPQRPEKIREAWEQSSALKRAPDASPSIMKKIYGISRVPAPVQKLPPVQILPPIIRKAPPVIVEHITNVPSYQYNRDLLSQLYLQAILKQEIKEEYDSERKKDLIEREIQRLLLLNPLGKKPKRKKSKPKKKKSKRKKKKSKRKKKKSKRKKSKKKKRRKKN